MAIQRTASSDAVEAFLRNHGLGDNAVSAFLGNLYKESGIISTNLQNCYNTKWSVTDAEYVEQVDAGTWADPIKGRPFTSDAGGFGIAQWTSSGRKTGLYNYAKAYGSSIGDLTMQCNWLWNEINSSGYKSLMGVLKANESVKACSDAIVKLYERPANQTEANLEKRAAAGVEFHALYYANVTETVEPASVTQLTENVTKGETQMYVMAQDQFISKLKLAAAKKTLYVLGCFGAPMTAKNKTRYSKNNAYNKGRAAMINAATSDTFGFDCVCLIKGILWGWSGDTSKTYGGAVYRANGVPDIGADPMMNKYCLNVTKDFTKIQPGWAVWMEGHIGVYIGDGKVIECTPKWSNKVQYSNLGNIDKYKVGHYRIWTKCGQLPWVEYAVQTESEPEAVSEDSASSAEVSGVSTTTTSAAVAELYVVKKGDSLSKIAAAYNVTVDSIVSANSIANPNIISIGQKLYIPVSSTTTPAESEPIVDTTNSAIAESSPVESVPEQSSSATYVVVKGDSLTKIGKKTGVAWKTIATLNGIKWPYIIRPGQELKLN